jgi:hypothetical protein
MLLTVGVCDEGAEGLEMKAGEDGERKGMLDGR